VSARLAVYRAVHSLRIGNTHKPAAELALDEHALDVLRACRLLPAEDVAWSSARLTEVRHHLEAERNFVRAAIVETTCKELGRPRVDEVVRPVLAARLSEDVRLRALDAILGVMRPAENAQQTVVVHTGA
jgi:hypothetical protein